MSQLCRIDNRVERLAGMGQCRWAIQWLSWALLATWCSVSLRAQETSWEAAPYRVLIWHQGRDSGLLAGWRERLPADLQAALEGSQGAMWQLQQLPAAEPLDPSVLAGNGTCDPVALVARHATLRDLDKLVLLDLTTPVDHILIRARELDLATRTWGVPQSLELRQPAQLTSACAQLVTQAVTRIGKIGRVRGGLAEVRIRAGLLATANQNAMLPRAGTLYHVRLRMNDRWGQPLPEGIQELRWTVLQVKSLVQARAHCEVVSGLRNPLRIRSSRQLERYACEVLPSGGSTTLQLVTRSSSAAGADGYGVFVKPAEGAELQFLGVTDWQGKLELTPDPCSPLQLLYVKNGQHALAKLPIVVGSAVLVRAELPDDDPRLEAEGFLRGIQEQIIEVAARGRILALRIRKQLADQDLPEAESLFETLNELDRRDDFLRRLQERQQSLSTEDRQVQARIDQLFRNTRQLLQQQFDSTEIDQLRGELSQRKNSRS